MGWQFWIDRGGTFTDIVAKRPDGKLIIHKLLSENPDRYEDAPVQGIREIMGIPANLPLPTEEIEAIKMGTTVATNALLERKGDKVVLLITQGFRDALRIGYQNRPHIFAREIILPEMLYSRVIEVEERLDRNGNQLIPLNKAKVEQDLLTAYEEGIRSCAIVLIHGYRYDNNEREIEAIASKIGFTQISVSHRVSPVMKLVSRGDTTVVDAYLSPILRRYVNRVQQQLNLSTNKNICVHRGTGILPVSSSAVKQPKLIFMQSNGGLVDANSFQGKDSILSGPAGGIVGAVKTSLKAGLDKIITFDMGGTSTDVAHYAGEYERTLETEIAGVRLRTPMMSIHTVAAGGGSIVKFEGDRYRVGPESGGANPGPACYGKGGALTITDCNVMVGKLQPQFFPKVFGIKGNLPLDREIVKEKFQQLREKIREKIGDNRNPEEIAAGFLAIAVQKMADAIKKISLERGYDVAKYTLCCFGGAGGQHACLIAAALGIKRVFIHPYAGVLSAYGIGLADIRILKERAVEAVLNSELIPNLNSILAALEADCQAELQRQQTQPREEIEPDNKQNDKQDIQIVQQVHLKYEGTDGTIAVNFASLDEMTQQFTNTRQQLYGFTVPDKQLIVEQVSVELICPGETLEEKIIESSDRKLTPMDVVSMYSDGEWRDTPVFNRDNLQAGDIIQGPAMIMEATGTNIIEPGWAAEVNNFNHLFLNRSSTGINGDKLDNLQDNSLQSLNTSLVNPNPSHSSSSSEKSHRKIPAKPDPILLEIFHNFFRSIAEQMGTTLQKTSYSVNIKERLDFSCAIFDGEGNLVANAPHIPAHLGSMSASISSLITHIGNKIKPRDVYISNNPYNGGSHLPDLTVISPVFSQNNSPAKSPIFYVASRGHHADLGGITPGSMPPHSKTIEEEGILIDNFHLVEQGNFRQTELLALFNNSPYPPRNTNQNIADLQAQIAANEKGIKELQHLVENYSLQTVQAYMTHIQSNGAECVRKAISRLKDGSFTCPLDGGGKICVTITINHENPSAKIDFTGTSKQLNNNLNAPAAICQAAVLYVFRTLVDDDIPLNQGCLQPLEIIIPSGSMLNPQYPAAVVAGNVETSQKITNCLYGALGAMAAAQGTMNNFTFGNQQYQYYETICGGSGAGPNFNGTDAIQTHMTNSRLTDPEVLEWRFPVLLESFAIRPQSGGKGLYCGGNGVVRRITFLEKMTAGILSESRIVAPFGLEGGESGAVGKNWLEKKDGTIQVLNSTATVEMEPGDTFIIETPGGGGYGVVSDQ